MKTPLLAVCLAVAVISFTGCREESPPSVQSGPAYGIPPVQVTAANFKLVVLQSDKPVLVDCYATWCGPCKAMEPALEELAADFQGRAVVARFDVDQENTLAATYNIQYLPTFLVFSQGKVVKKIEGAGTKKELRTAVEAAIGN